MSNYEPETFHKFELMGDLAALISDLLLCTFGWLALETPPYMQLLTYAWSWDSSAPSLRET